MTDSDARQEAFYAEKRAKAQRDLDPAYRRELWNKVPTEAKPGETGECVGCGLEFEQRGDGSTAGNFCASCWELRNIRIQGGIERAKRNELWGNRIAKLMWVGIALAIAIWVFLPSSDGAGPSQNEAPQNVEDIDCDAMLTEAMQEYCAQLTPSSVPDVQFVYEENAPYGAEPIGAMVDGEFWLECSYTSDMPPCWTFGTTEGTLYWPDGSVSRFY